MWTSEASRQECRMTMPRSSPIRCCVTLTYTHPCLRMRMHMHMQMHGLAGHAFVTASDALSQDVACPRCAGREHDRWRGREHWHGNARAQTDCTDVGGAAVRTVRASMGPGEADTAGAGAGAGALACDHSGSPIARCPVQHLREMYRTKFVKGRSRSVHGRAGPRGHPQFEPGKVVVGFKLVP